MSETQLTIKIRIFVIAALLTITVGAISNVRVKEKRPELKRALHALQTCRQDLMKADRDYGGHRTKAVQAVDMAIDEVKQSIAFEAK